MRRFWAFLIVVTVTLVATRADDRITVDDLMRLATITDVRIAPDGRRVAYAVSTPSFETNAHEAVLYTVPSTGGTPTRLTYTTRVFNRPLPLSELRWSPDGSMLSFLAWADNAPQVFAMSATGGEPRVLTAATSGVTAYEWSPDGARLAFLAQDPPLEEEERRRRDGSFVIEVDRQERPSRVWVQQTGASDTAGGERAARPVTPRDHFVSSVSWAPDGRTIAYSASQFAGWMSQFNSRVYLVPVDGGAPRALVDRPGMNTGVSYSPDGNWIAFQSTGGRVAFLSTWGLHIVRASEPGTGEIRDLGAKTEAWAGQYVWSADSRSLVQVPGEGTGGRGEHMFEQPLWRVSIEDATIDALTPGRFVQFQPGLSRDGRWLAYRSVEPRTMGDIEVMDLDTRQRTRVTDVNPELRGRTLGTLEPIRWTSFDGMEIWGLLLTPPGYRASTGAGQTPGPSAGPPRGRLPLVVYCHGGPIGGFSYGLFPQFMHRPGQIEPYPVEAMAAEGMAVLMPMPRGGSGYGEAGFRTIVHAWGVDDFKDIMAGVDHLVSIGVADPERLGVMGASYGGYMTSWIVTQTTRFKAASTGASLTDLAGMFYLSDAGDPIAEYFGLPWEHPDRYRAHSPITHAGNVTTPLLIQHGENDRRVPVTQARQFYEALKRRNKIVELEIYPRAGHVVYEPVLEREQMRRNLAWFTRWLTP